MNKSAKKYFIYMIFLTITETSSIYADVNGKWVNLDYPMKNFGNTATSIAINKLGVPYVAFDDSEYGYRDSVISYQVKNGWQYVGSPGFSSDTKDYPYDDGVAAIAFDNNQTPYVVYDDWGFLFSVMKYTTNGWQYVGNPRIAKGSLSCKTTHIAFDPSGTPYIVFVTDYGSDNQVIVMKYDGSNWLSVGAIKTNHGVGGASIAIDRNGIQYVAYVDTSEKYTVVVKRYSSENGWVSIGSDDLTDIINDAGNIDIAIDKNQIPYIAYIKYDMDGRRPTVVKKYVSSHWVDVGALPTDKYTIHYGVRLVLDSHNYPLISFLDGGKESKGTVMKYTDNDGWVVVGYRKFTDGTIAHGLSLSTDAYDTPYVAYSMMNPPYYGITVMKFQNTE